MKTDEHISVLLLEAIEGLRIKENGIYVDCTLGRAGHSKEILKRLSKDGLLIAFDCDEEAIAYSEKELSKISNNFKIIHSNFRNLKEELQKLHIDKVDGILYDLGVSSPQFDESYRGFSYRYDSQLDMRMDLSLTIDAKDIINNYSLEDLTRIFKEYGEEKYSYNIAKRIVSIRSKRDIKTTFELVDIIKSSIPKKEQIKKHPAKKVFQALRIEVNDELNALKTSLDQSLSLIKDEGRIVVISFHSLEDRIVKEKFKEVSQIKGDRKNDYLLPKDIKKPSFKLVTRHVVTPTQQELEVNRRSKSAKLRILEKIKGE